MFKKWILSLPFITQAVVENNEELYRKAFKHAREDLEETRIDDIEERADELSKQRISKLLGIFDENLVITRNAKTGIVYIGGEQVESGRLISLKQEAEYLVSTDIWKIINSSLNHVTRQAMFEKSDFTNGTRDLDNGKSILYTLSFQNNILELLRSYQHKDSNKGGNVV